MKKPTRHPATTKLFQDAAQRWMDLQKEHHIACERMWTGTITSNFTAAELALLTDYLSPNDRRLIESVKRASS